MRHAWKESAHGKHQLTCIHGYWIQLAHWKHHPETLYAVFIPRQWPACETVAVRVARKGTRHRDYDSPSFICTTISMRRWQNRGKTS